MKVCLKIIILDNIPRQCTLGYIGQCTMTILFTPGILWTMYHDNVPRGYYGQCTMAMYPGDIMDNAPWQCTPGDIMDNVPRPYPEKMLNNQPRQFYPGYVGQCTTTLYPALFDNVPSQFIPGYVGQCVMTIIFCKIVHIIMTH